jgi:lysozyme
MNATISPECYKALVEFEGLFRYGRTTPRIAPPGPGANIATEDPTRIYSYMDPINLETIGIGHLLTEEEKTSGIINIQGMSVRWRAGLTLAQTNALKNQDVAIHTRPFWTRNWPKPITQTQFDALAMLSFNIGVGRIAAGRSRVGDLMAQGKYTEAADAFMVWTRAGGRELPGLVRRRSWERQHFLKPSEFLIDPRTGTYIGKPPAWAIGATSEGSPNIRRVSGGAEKIFIPISELITKEDMMAYANGIFTVFEEDFIPDVQFEEMTVSPHALDDDPEFDILPSL